MGTLLATYTITYLVVSFTGSYIFVVLLRGNNRYYGTWNPRKEKSLNECIKRYMFSPITFLLAALLSAGSYGVLYFMWK